MRRLLFIIASLLVSSFLLWLALRDVELDKVWEQIRGADMLWLLACAFSLVGALWTRAVRWRGLLDFKISLRDSFHIVNITFLVNLIPLRVGEIARSLLSARSGVPVMTAATAVVVERLLDTLLMVLMLAVSLSNIPDAPPEATSAASLFGIAAVVGFGALIFFARYPDVARRLLAFAENLLPFLKRLPLERMLDNVLEGLQLLTDWRRFAYTLGWSLIAWVFSMLSLYTLYRALDINYINLLLGTTLGVTLASFSIAVPVSVAAVGPFEGAIRVTGEIVGMTAVDSASLGLLFHGVAISSYAIFGVIGLMALGVSLGDMLKRKPEEPAEDDAAEN